MKLKIMCTMCKTPHFDHYECSGCGNEIHEIIDDRMPRWKFCPYCGLSFDEKEKEYV